MLPLPPRLYRYRSVDGPAQARTKRIIETGLHYFASPTSFNDPFDCRPNFAFDSDENSVREYLYGMCARQAPHMSEEARKQEVDAILQDPARDPRILDNAIFTKSDAWAYEKEWRILHYQHGPGERQSPHACLKAIIVGLAMSGTNRRLVESWANASPAKPAVIRTHFSPSEFSIMFPKAH